MKPLNILLMLVLYTAANSFTGDTLPPPEIRKVTPEIAYVNAHACLRGQNFGTDANTVQVFIGKTEAPLVFVKDDSLVFAITDAIKNGANTLTVARDGIKSNTVIIEVDTLNIAKTLRTVIGGIAFLLFGIFILSRGLRHFIGRQLFVFLPAMRRKPWIAFISGMGISTLTQSSTIAAVLLLGFVSAGFLPLASSVVALCGANIGSSIIALFLQFDIAKHGLWVIAAGIFFQLISKILKREWYFDEILLGLGFVLYGMQLTMNSFSSLADYTAARNLFQVFSTGTPAGFLWCMATGIAGTVLLQSPAAFMVVLLGIAKTTMFVDFHSSIAMLLGANLAAIVTTIIVAHLHPGPGRTFGRAHCLVNIGGTLFAMALFIPIVSLVDALIPFDPSYVALGKKVVHPYIGTHIAVAFLTINLAANLPFLFLYNRIAALCTRGRNSKPAPEVLFRQSLIGITGKESAEKINELLVHEISRLLQILRDYIHKVKDVYSGGATDQYVPIQLLHKNIADHSTQILSLLGTMSTTRRDLAGNRKIEHITYISGELSRITGPLMGLLDTAIATADLRIATQSRAGDTIREMTAKIDTFITLVTNIIDDPESYDRMEVRYLEITINRIEDLAKSRLIAAIGSGGCLPQHGQYLINVIGAYEQMGNTLYRIADFMFMQESRENAAGDNF